MVAYCNIALESTSIYGMHRIYGAFLKENSVKELCKSVTFYTNRDSTIDGPALSNLVEDSMVDHELEVMVVGNCQLPTSADLKVVLEDIY